MTDGLDLFGRPVAKKGNSLSKSQEELLTKAWRSLIFEWGLLAQNNKIYSPNISKGTLAVQFVRALIYGEEIPRSATMAYNPSRFYVNGDGNASGRPFNEIFAKALDNPSTLNSLRFALSESTSFDAILGSPLPVHGHRMPNDFPVSLAKELINKYCPTGGFVLDPCHGWGGRIIGFLLSNASYYCGFDPSHEVNKGVQSIFDDLVNYLPNPNEKFADLYNMPFEKADFLEPNTFDFALTSPPYFDTEKYDGEESSWRMYKTYDQWVSGFYKPMIEQVASSLVQNAVFALQVASKRYPLMKTALSIVETVSLKHITTRHSVMSTGQYKTDQDAGEVVLIFKKVKHGS